MVLFKHLLVSFLQFNGVIGIVIVAHISAYLTTVECGIGGGFSESVAVYVAAFFSNVIGLNQARIIGAFTTHDNNFNGIDRETPVGECTYTIYNNNFMRNFSQTFTNDPNLYGVILVLVIFIENIFGDVETRNGFDSSFMPAIVTRIIECCFYCLKASVNSCIINNCQIYNLDSATDFEKIK